MGWDLMSSFYIQIDTTDLFNKQVELVFIT